MAPPTLTDELRGYRDEVIKRVQESEDTVHRFRCRRFDYAYALWSSFHEFKGDMANRTDARDRDAGLQQAKRDWGADLFIPYTYATIETMLPMMYANRPRMLVLPRNRNSEHNVENVKFMIDAQQEKARYELKIQSIGKDGLIFGIGWGKTRWRKQLRNKPTVVRAMPNTQGLDWVGGDPELVQLWDDPDAERCDPYDVMYDPMATAMHNCGWIVHRLWRSTEYVVGQLKSGAWNLTPGLTEEDVRGMGRTDEYSAQHAGRRRVEGQATFKLEGEVHEVLEAHDGARVIVVLDREWPVAMGENPDYRGKLPFHCFRPTERPGAMVGVGEPEVTEDLQVEMNTLRTQRRDNATLKLMQTWAYNDGAIDPDDMKIGPGFMIPVRGEPRDLLFPLTVGDIPNSGYQEEARLQADIERASGLNDLGDQQGGIAETATGAQLMVAGQNRRVALKSRRLEVELIEEQAEAFVVLSQARIVANRDIRIPYTPKPGEPDRRWAWHELSPELIAGDFEFKVEGGSTAPDNVPQDRADANTLLNGMLAQPQLAQTINQREVLKLALEKLGVKNPEMYLAPDMQVPPELLPVMKEMMVTPQEQGGFGVDPAMADQIISRSLVVAQKAHEQSQEGGGPQLPTAAGEAGGNGQVTTAGGPEQQGPPVQGPPEQGGQGG